MKAMDEGKIAAYVTDFPTKELLQYEQVIGVPHLGASTPESEENCAVMAVRQLQEYLENGNILHSVNFPDCDMGVCTAESRVVIFHKNIANMIAKFSSVLGWNNLNIANMMNKSKGDVAYTMIDLESPVSGSIVNQLKTIDGVFRVRVVK